MSFAVPRNVPNFQASQRDYEDSFWSSSGQSKFSAGTRSSSGLSISPFGAFRGNRELPMYKDKPYNYPFSQRARSKKLWVALILVVVIAWWYFVPSIFGRKGIRLPIGRPLDLGRIAKGDAGWLQKRDAVVRAMEKTWSGYEKHAWGMTYRIDHKITS
jgi:endoplasmic reticulum Man9GlcNAc2 1,2-alpha-mannosidase